MNGGMVMTGRPLGAELVGVALGANVELAMTITLGASPAGVAVLSKPFAV